MIASFSRAAEFIAIFSKRVAIRRHRLNAAWTRFQILHFVLEQRDLFREDVRLAGETHCPTEPLPVNPWREYLN